MRDIEPGRSEKESEVKEALYRFGTHSAEIGKRIHLSPKFARMELVELLKVIKAVDRYLAQAGYTREAHDPS